MVLSGYRTHRTYLYDWPSADLDLARPFLVWQMHLGLSYKDYVIKESVTLRSRLIPTM